jgi:chloramphenicol phosphotransferase-like protein
MRPNGMSGRSLQPFLLSGAGRSAANPFAWWQQMRPRFFDGFYRCLPALAAVGNDLIIEHIIEFRAWREYLARLLGGLDVFLVGVHCEVTEIDRRERDRGTAASARAGRMWKPACSARSSPTISRWTRRMPSPARWPRLYWPPGEAVLPSSFGAGGYPATGEPYPRLPLRTHRGESVCGSGSPCAIGGTAVPRVGAVR